MGRSQSSEGFDSHSVSAGGMGREVASLICSRSAGPVDEDLVRLSARMAEAVDFRGRCCTVTRHPRKFASM